MHNLNRLRIGRFELRPAQRLLLHDGQPCRLGGRAFDVLMLLLEKINELGTTVLVVTHEKELVDAFSKRVISIDAGRVISDGLDGYYGYEAE